MGKQQYTTQSYINKAIEIHENKYSYDCTKYTKAHDYIDVRCLKHGTFKIKAYAHLQGKGCKQCAIEEKALNRRTTTEEFIKQSKEIFGDEYIYNKTKYGKNNKEKVCITCPIHGDFWIRPYNHLYNKIGCPHCACKASKYELEIYNILRDKLPPNIQIIQKDRTILNNQELDIYIPQLNIAIEFDGIRWHSAKFGGKNDNYHLNKTIECNKQNISLIHIFENEWLENKELCLSKLLHKLNIDNNQRISANKCKFKYTPKDRVIKFIKENTFSDITNEDFTHWNCLYYKDKLVATICYNITPNKAHITHLITSRKHFIIGAIGRLINTLKMHFEEVYINADRRWLLNIENNSLTKLGFKIDSISNPRKLWYDVKISQTKLFLEKPSENSDWVNDCGIITYKWIKNI